MFILVVVVDLFISMKLHGAIKLAVSCDNEEIEGKVFMIRVLIIQIDTV